MLLRDLNIEAYRGVRTLVLPELGRFNVLVGANNSGKTSVLEAAALLCRPSDHAQWSRVVQHRDFLSRRVPIESLWELFPNAMPLSFEDGLPLCNPINIVGLFPEGHRGFRAQAVAEDSGELLPNGAPDIRIQVRATMTDLRPGSPSGFGLRFASHRPFPRLPENGLQSRMTRSILVSPSARCSSTWLVDLLGTTIEQGRKTDAIDMLRLFDNQIEGIELVQRSTVGRILVQHKTRGMTALATFGQGMQAALALALGVSKARGGVLLLDELEVGIHNSLLVDVLDKLMLCAEASNVQVICTTHSLETVDALIEAAERRSCLPSLVGYWLRRTATEHSARRYPGDKLRSLREGGIDIR